METTDPRVTVARKLAALAEELRAGKSFRITRLTVLKRLCADGESAARFACYLADRSQNHFRAAPTVTPGCRTSRNVQESDRHRGVLHPRLHGRAHP